jgi:tetratricopeptide (TPR) repeat protein
VKAGKLVVIGVVQEQHPDRARLYRQWRQLGWPIYIDSINTLDLSFVPVPVGIDECGVIRLEGRITKEAVKEFVEKEYPKSETPANRAERPDLKSLQKARDQGDWHFLYDSAADALDRAIESYEATLRNDPKDARAEFRLGVAYRARYDSPRRKIEDVQRAVEHWGNGLALNPNQYIWRRRIQQFGPRLDKPYDFYFWVEEARKDILARGEKPMDLVVEPTGSEVAPPSKGEAAGTVKVPDPDPQGKIHRDDEFVAIEPSVIPARVRPGARIRVRVTFRLSESPKAHWNNEGDPLKLSVKLPETVSLVEGGFRGPTLKEATSLEVRVLEFEATVAATAPAGALEIPGYAIYDVCEDAGGTCRHLRRDLKITVTVDPKAPALQ